MRVICDAPGQTCNRLWTYVPTIARCIAEHKRMVIIFYDWTIEDFPNLLHARFIYFPLWHKWYLERGNGWNNYKGLTWKVTHSKTWDSIFRMLGFKKGWDTMDDTRYLKQTKKELQHIFRPKKEITDKAEAMMAEIRKEADIVVGVHIRQGDYKTFINGRFYYTLEEYHQFMLRIMENERQNNELDELNELKESKESHEFTKRVAFFISSNESFSTDIFTGCRCYRFGKEPSGAILDLYTLSLCDKIVGPWSTYSRWVSFMGEVPLCCLKGKQERFTDEDFSVITDFYHFANGENTVNYWLEYGYQAED